MGFHQALSILNKQDKLLFVYTSNLDPHFESIYHHTKKTKESRVTNCFVPFFMFHYCLFYLNNLKRKNTTLEQLIEKPLFTYKLKSGEMFALNMYIFLYLFLSVVVTSSIGKASMAVIFSIYNIVEKREERYAYIYRFIVYNIIYLNKYLLFIEYIYGVW